MEISEIVVLSDGFLIKPPDKKYPTQPDLKKFYMVVFNNPRNHQIATQIASYIRKDKKKYKQKDLISDTGFNRDRIYNFWYQITQREDRLKKPFTDFHCYRIFNKQRRSELIDSDIELRKNIIRAFIRKETRENINYYWLGSFKKIDAIKSYISHISRIISRHSVKNMC